MPRVESILRRKPFALGPLQLRIHRLTYFRYYRFENVSGRASIRFWPELPDQFKGETDQSYRERKTAYETRFQELRGREDDFAIEFDAEIVFPGGSAVELRGVPASNGVSARGAVRINSTGILLRRVHFFGANSARTCFSFSLNSAGFSNMG